MTDVGSVVALGLAVTLLWTTGCSNDGSSATNSAAVTSAEADVPSLALGERLGEGQQRSLGVGTHCGVRVLGMLINDVAWITDEATLEGDWIPDEWAASIVGGQELITVVVELSPGSQTLSATAAQRSVRYRPVSGEDQLVDCA